MHRNLKFASAAVFALCGLCLASQAQNQTLPDGKGKAEFIHNCTACHRADMVTRVKKTSAEWHKSVVDMAARGSDGTPADLDNVVLYLDKFYSKDSPAPSTTTAAPAPAASDADATLASGIIADGGCLTCHRIEQQGAYLAPTLNGVGTRRTAEQVKASIVSPPATVDPAYDLVRLVKSDGSKLTARLLSQDDQHVRVIDASGEVATYTKADLQKFTIDDSNPMPSFGRRIAPDDMDGLIRYLRSLPAVNGDDPK